MISYIPDWWELEENGDVVLGFYTGEFEITIESDQYERIHAVNPMSESISDSVLMERSNLRFSIA